MSNTRLGEFFVKFILCLAGRYAHQRVQPRNKNLSSAMTIGTQAFLVLLIIFALGFSPAKAVAAPKVTKAERQQIKIDRQRTKAVVDIVTELLLEADTLSDTADPVAPPPSESETSPPPEQELIAQVDVPEMEEDALSDTADPVAPPPSESETSPLPEQELTAQGDVPYDLYATDSRNRGLIPFQVNWPEPPRTTRTIQVPNDMSFSAAQNVAGAVIHVAAGDYGPLRISQNDQAWLFDSGAHITGLSVANRPQRIVLSGGTGDMGGQQIPMLVDDFLMMNVDYDNIGNLLWGFGDITVSRVAIIQNRLHCWAHCVFTPGATANTGGNFGSDLIVAGNYMQGGMDPANSGIEATVRIMSMERVVLVDNRSRNGRSGEGVKNVYRSLYGNKDFWARRNMIEYGDGWKLSQGSASSPPNNVAGRHWIYDTVHYLGSDNASASVSSAATRDSNSGMSVAWPEPLVTGGNIQYSSETSITVNNTESSTWRWSPQAGDPTGANVRSPYQTPPALAQWTVTGGLPPGADH